MQSGVSAHHCSYCPQSTQSLACAGRLHFQSFPDRESSRVLSTTDVGIERAGGADSPMQHISGALTFQAFCPWC